MRLRSAASKVTRAPYRAAARIVGNPPEALYPFYFFREEMPDITGALPRELLEGDSDGVAKGGLGMPVDIQQPDRPQQQTDRENGERDRAFEADPLSHGPP